MQDQPPIQVIPIGVTAPKSPNQKFSMYFKARQEARKEQDKINKTLPLPRHVK